MSKFGRRAGPGSPSFIAVARACTMSARSSAKSFTPIVKIGEAIPPQKSFAGPIPFAPHRAAKGRPELGIVLAILMATNVPAHLVENGSGQIPLGRLAFDRVMAADEIERADKTAVAAAIAKAAFYPTLAITEVLQQQVQDFDGFCGVARIHDNGSRYITAPDRGEAPPTYHLPAAPPYISSTRHEIPPATPCHGCGATCSRCPSRRCRSRSRHRAPAASDRRWC